MKYLIFSALSFIQALGWVVMMYVVAGPDKNLGNSVLYVTEISHWALVIGAVQIGASMFILYQAEKIHKHVHKLDKKK